MDAKESRSQGFTLIEIGVIVPILIMIVLVLFDALFALIRTSTVERGKIDMVHDKQTALNIIESDIILSSTFLPKIDTTTGIAPKVETDPYPPSTNGGAWSYLGSSATDRTLILRTYSTSLNPLHNDRQPVFINDNDPAGAACTATNIYFNSVQQHNVVFFVKNKNLYRRILTDKTTLLCGTGQYQKYSCPSQSDLTAQGLGTRNSVCQVDDELLAKDVSNFAIQYYDTKESTSPLSVYAVGADPALVATGKDVAVSITLSRKASGEPISSTSTLRISKLNMGN